ncbi:MAG: hypothetical protein JSR97_12485 [Verrucomicrobia bacterium]|nr:hypothetical protein [Verrucomicrobiota bacterium]
MSKELFKSYPSVNVFYKTSDGQFFEQKHDAEAHARSLKDKDVETVEREKKPAADEAAKAAADKAAKAAADKAAKAAADKAAKEATK